MTAQPKVSLTKIESAVGKVFKNAAHLVGNETDPDLILYERLKPADFPKLIEKFGAENVIRYIQEMEAKKMARKHG